MLLDGGLTQYLGGQGHLCCCWIVARADPAGESIDGVNVARTWGVGCEQWQGVVCEQRFGGGGGQTVAVGYGLGLAVCWSSVGAVLRN